MRAQKKKTHLDTAGVGQKAERLLLVPLGELAAAEDEAELLAGGQLRHEGLAERPGGRQREVDLDPSVRLDVGELRRPPADGPV